MPSSASLASTFSSRCPHDDPTRIVIHAEGQHRFHASSGARITELESEIADRREFYNDSVNTFDTRIQEISDALLAEPISLHSRQMFRAA
jgi:UTP:GlnB (protein PII) uridylyltransferase